MIFLYKYSQPLWKPKVYHVRKHLSPQTDVWFSGYEFVLTSCTWTRKLDITQLFWPITRLCSSYISETERGRADIFLGINVWFCVVSTVFRYRL